MKKLLYGIVLCPVFLFAQLNESDTLKVKAKLSVTGFWQRGNVETSIFRSRADFSIRPFGKLVYKTQNSYVYQAFGRTKADEDILSLNFLYFNPKAKIYPLVLGFVSTNFRREIDLRYLWGAGATYQVHSKDNDWLKVSMSLEYEETDFKSDRFNIAEFNGNQTIDTFRGTIWINGKYYLFEKKVVLTHEGYIQSSLESSSNYRWQADIGAEFPIWKFLSFKINYLSTFESVVIEGQQQGDQFYSFGLTLKNF